MSNPNKHADNVAERERTLKIARALGADVVYPVLGTPSVVDYASGNFTIDRENPIYEKPPQVEGDN